MRGLCTLRMNHLVLAVVILLPTAAPSAFQSPSPDPPAPQTDGPRRGGGPGRVIDGAKNPELIDTELLIAQILGSNAMGPAPTERDELRLRSFARRIGLGNRDTEILRSEMIRLYGEMAPVRDRLQGSRNPLADLAEFRDVRLQTYGRLLELWSADGRRKFDEFIEREKRNTYRSAPSQPQ
jgi:hypothetical protein